MGVQQVANPAWGDRGEPQFISRNYNFGGAGNPGTAELADSTVDPIVGFRSPSIPGRR